MKQDKLLHVLGGLAVVFIAMPCYFNGGLFAGLWSCITGLVWGCVKEWSDYQHDCKWDWKDLLATAIGVVFVALLILGMHYGKG